MLQIDYQGIEYQYSKQAISLKETYKGKLSEVNTFVDEQKLNIGKVVAGKGKLKTINKTQDDGVFWKVTLNYQTTLVDGTDNTTADETTYGKKSQTLSVRNISLPIEKHPNYRTKWKYYLIGKEEKANTIPSWACNTKSTVTSNPDEYRFISDLSQIPDDVNEAGERLWKVCRSGSDVAEPLKPGVQSFDWAVYTITESQKFGSASSAGNSVQKNINTIVSSPEYGNMGISGGDWKADDCSVSYDGKYWIATTTYSKSGDGNGWDKQIYRNSTNDSNWSL